MYAESAAGAERLAEFRPDSAPAFGPPFAMGCGMSTPQTRPSFTRGLHYFCDHRCWRCPLSRRCAVFARWSDPANQKKTLFTGPGGRVASVLAVSLDVTMEEAVTLAAEAALMTPETAISAFVPAARPTPPPTHERHPPPLRRAEQDPLVIRGGEYAQCSWPVLRALRPALSSPDDRDAADAVERLEEMSATVASKIFRAVSSSFDVGAACVGVQGDANGSAKVALLLIEESRQAWRVLMRPGHAIADGAPARFVAMLDVLETGLLQRFPHALEFVRPGFDTGESPEAGSRLARAMLVAHRAPKSA